MNHPHQLNISLEKQNPAETVSLKFLKEGQLKARFKTIKLLEAIQKSLAIGMTESDARKLTLKLSKEMGVITHWHQPYIRFGVGTTLTFHNPMQPDYKLQANDPYYIDLGPVWNDPETEVQYEGDYGDTFIFGENPEAKKCIDAAHTLFNEVRKSWKTEKLTGQEIYQLLECRATELGYKLAPKVEGHRLSDFPHHQYSRKHLADLNFCPTDSAWVLEVQLIDLDDRFGAFFEDLL